MAISISSDLIVGNALLKIWEENVDFEKIVDFNKKMEEGLKGTDYFSCGICYYDIMSFCETYPYFAKADFETERVRLVSINNEIKKRMERYFQLGLHTTVFNAMNVGETNKKLVKVNKYK